MAVRAPQRFSASRKGLSLTDMSERISQLVAEGLSNRAIAVRVGSSERTVERYRQRNRMNGGQPIGSFIHVPKPKPRDELDPEVLACLEDTPEGFERFFNRYSGLTLAPHSKRFVQSCFDYDKGRWKLRVLILVPSDHAKTSVFSTWMQIWRIAQDRSFRSIIASETAEFATQIAREIALELEENPDLVSDLGRFRSDKANSWWQPGKGALKVEGATFKRGYNVLARGAGTQIQGLRAEEVVVDDLIGPEDVLTDERRQRTLWWLQTVVISRVDPGTRIFVIATRQHLHDIYGTLMEQKTLEGEPAWEVIQFPALRDPTTGQPSMADDALPLWPELRPRSYFIKEILPHVTSTAFALAWQQDPLPEAEKVFRGEFIHGSDLDPNLNRGCLDRERTWGPIPLESGWVRCISIDPSPQNYWAMLVADVKEDREEFSCKVLEIVREKLTVPRFMEHMERLVVAYAPSLIIPEKNSANLFILQSADWSTFEARHREPSGSGLTKRRGTSRTPSTGWSPWPLIWSSGASVSPTPTTRRPEVNLSH